MKLEADAEMAVWLRTMLQEDPLRVDWDAANEPKLGKHRVTRADVMRLLGGDVAFGGRIVEPAHPEPRWLLLGATARRKLAVVVTRRGDWLRPITCRPMRRNERRLYEAHQAETDPDAHGDAQD
jgi:uncharacterized DUF497 family protein